MPKNASTSPGLRPASSWRSSSSRSVAAIASRSAVARRRPACTAPGASPFGRGRGAAATGAATTRRPLRHASAPAPTATSASGSRRRWLLRLRAPDRSASDRANMYPIAQSSSLTPPARTSARASRARLGPRASSMSPRAFAPRRHLAQEAAHDLAGARLGQRVGEADLVGPRERADLLATCSRSSLRERRRRP